MTDKRLHERYSLLPPGAGFIIADGESLPVKDLSYGGLQLQGIPDGADNTSIIHDRVLQLFGEKTPVKFKVAYYSKTNSGLIFVHDTPTTLLFLRQPLEYIRAGTSLKKIDSSMLHERYREHQSRLYRGDLQSELLVMDNHPSTGASLVASIRMGEQQKQLRFNRNEFVTGIISKAEQLVPTSASLEMDERPDHYTVRMVTALLTGAITQLTDPVLENALTTFIDRLNRQTEMPDLQKAPITK